MVLTGDDLLPKKAITDGVEKRPATSDDMKAMMQAVATRPPMVHTRSAKLKFVCELLAPIRSLIRAMVCCLDRFLPVTMVYPGGRSLPHIVSLVPHLCAYDATHPQPRLQHCGQRQR
jgi:hypothetical protein